MSLIAADVRDYYWCSDNLIDIIMIASCKVA